MVPADYYKIRYPAGTKSMTLIYTHAYGTGRLLWNSATGRYYIHDSDYVCIWYQPVITK